MAFSKNKALENALKFLNQGKIPQAIGEYQQILRYDQKDQATLMTVGDLCARQGDLHQAAEYFGRLAELYAEEGFNSKAIAIYKKINKLAPAELAPLEHLADLYVQQGVLSEARPIFLQLAEAHLKANHAPQAVEVLRRLVDLEPDNSRVQMRLAELYNIMGRKKESADTYCAYAQRLFDGGDAAEALKFVDRSLEVEAASPGPLLLKARILSTAQKDQEAAAILAQHPEADAGGDVTTLLADAELKCGQFDSAIARARRQLERDKANCRMLHRVAEALLEAGRPRDALPLLRELRDPMIDAGEQDEFLKALSSATQKLPGDPEPLEMLAEFCGHTSDPFQLNVAQSQLVDAYAAAENYTRAEELLQELIERNKDDDRLVQRLAQLRARQNGEVPPENVPATTVVVELAPPTPEQGVPTAAPEEPLDSETEAYIAQALTDVDLFSSYGLTQKAIHLLESVLERAPRHTPTLERLLDFYVGAGNQHRTAELAAQLEHIYKDRGDTVNTDRYAELGQKFREAAGLSEAPPAPADAPPAKPASIESVFAASPAPAEGGAPSSPPAPPAAPAEFEVPLAPGKKDEGEAAAAGRELDLSDEWEAITQETAEPAAVEPQSPHPSAATPTAPKPTEPAPPAQAGSETTAPLIAPPAVQSPPQETAPAGHEDLVLELSSETGSTPPKSGPATTEEFLNELAAEIEDMQTPHETPAENVAPAPAVPVQSAPVAAALPQPAGAKPPASSGTGSLDDLADVFQQFRNELGETSEEEEEDLETHYNLGVAYREMGLLDEAIGEFQKVAKAVQEGKPFPYAMNCSALLALSFMDKGEPKIASVWYQRALQTPGLGPEAILALRYDLGAALDLAGESGAALENFRQVYAMNIDYRDVAERISALQKR